ncbi:N-acyl homoserine lactonase family protein [Alicyclobacillus fastidiosus]|uniref:N-acyl homoserine lactonase family protein n=1 Tax=Alicyclobacillus fastidiosus TaxID=392011 RepID=A0ABV5AKP5_9BACL|nr:N-acyl homoserine lactonase family protein [Alicyclobacillus fastidiosus]WEH08295.1 N-acyl homoserine lactonase family protein [Alicyclobacillus fastidiosus]
MWKVTALKMGELTVAKASITYDRDYGQSIVIPIWAAAITGGGYNILVDTGVHDVDWVTEHVSPCRRADDEGMVAALKKGPGWAPEDVDIVINTHLHYDHIGNNRLFPNARFIVQEREWQAAHNPIPSQRGIYLPELFDSIDYFSWNFVNGEEEIVPGIKVFLTPGHSDGHQSVLVKTDQGTLCVSGDVSNLLENIRENVPAGILTSTKDIFESMDRVRSKAEYIFPGHEPSIRKFQTGDFPTIVDCSK